MINPENFIIKTEEKREEENMEAKFIKFIEESSLTTPDKKDLLLVCIGEKAAVWMPAEDCFDRNNTEEEKDVRRRIEEKKMEIKDVVEKLDTIFYEFIEFENEESDGRIKKGFNFIAGNSRENLNNLKKSFEIPSSRNRGIALGYPESAVGGYMRDDVFDVEETEAGLGEEEVEELKKLLKFGGFGLSTSNWREEIKTIERYRDAINEKSPEIYKDILEQ